MIQSAYIISRLTPSMGGKVKLAIIDSSTVADKMRHGAACHTHEPNCICSEAISAFHICAQGWPKILLVFYVNPFLEPKIRSGLGAVSNPVRVDKSSNLVPSHLVPVVRGHVNFP